MHTDHYVMEYIISYGTDNLDYSYYKEPGGSVRVSLRNFLFCILRSFERYSSVKIELKQLQREYFGIIYIRNQLTKKKFAYKYRFFFYVIYISSLFN